MKYGIALAVAVFLAFVGIGIYRAGNDEIPPPGNNPQIVFGGGKIFGRRIETRSWSASYDKIVSSPDQTALDVEGVHDGLIERKGKPYLRVSAKHMTVNTLTHDFNVTGALHVETIGTGPKRSFDTTNAVWNEGTHTLTLSDRGTIRSSSEMPLVFSRATFDVKTGELDAHDLRGGAGS